MNPIGRGGTSVDCRNVVDAMSLRHSVTRLSRHGVPRASQAKEDRPSVSVTEMSGVNIRTKGAKKRATLGWDESDWPWQKLIRYSVRSDPDLGGPRCRSSDRIVWCHCPQPVFVTDVEMSSASSEFVRDTACLTRSSATDQGLDNFAPDTTRRALK